MKTREYKITQFVAHSVMAFCSLLVAVPFLLLFIASLTDNEWAISNGFSFFPAQWSLDAYRYIGAQWEMIGRAYLMTILVTGIGTALSVIVSALFAYAICQQDIPVMRVLGFMLIFTMLFNGGLVATYYSYVNFFGVKDTIWGLILPGLMMNAFSVILLRNYFRNTIPRSLVEAAYLDGAGEFLVFFRIVVPLSKPIIATIALMTGLGYWNDWQNGLYYLSPRYGGHLYTIQVILNNINENIALLQANRDQLAGMTITMPSTTIRMAIAIVGILPILVIYPFFQKYFVKGITLGGVKE